MYARRSYWYASGSILLCCLVHSWSPHRADAQSFTATSVLLSGTAWNGSAGSMVGTREVRPLTIVNASPVPQPIVFYAGPDGSDRIVEMSSFGETWVKTSVSIGPGVGAASTERARIGQIVNVEGRGLVVGMAGTSTSTGILIENIGLTGTEHAGIVLSGSSNGTGTGLRIGGPQGSSRPTVATGIDVTGGTGLRYNALNPGSGTAIDIGSTMQPQLGVECTVAGPNSIGVIARANTTGMGVVGISKSAAYADPTLLPRVGIHGYSANNSNASADSIIGVLGSVVRGGNGGTATRSIAVEGIASSTAVSHSGFMVGVLGQASAPAPGVSFGVGGLFHAEPTPQHLALFTIGADVYLGGVRLDRPAAIVNAPPELRVDNPTTTWMYNAIASGNVSLRGTLDIKSVFNAALPAGRGTMVIPPSCIVAIDGGEVVTLTGLEGATHGRVLSIVVRRGVAILVHNDPVTQADQRFALPGGVDILLRTNGSAVLWYDQVDQHWRLLAVVP